MKNVPMVLTICATAHHYRLMSRISTQICTSHVVVRNSCPRRINRVVAINMQKLVPAGPYSGGRRAAIATVRRSGIFVPLKDEIERLAPDVTKTVRRARERYSYTSQE